MKTSKLKSYILFGKIIIHMKLCDKLKLILNFRLKNKFINEIFLFRGGAIKRFIVRVLFIKQCYNCFFVSSIKNEI